jgi:hypothetical protein
MVPATQAHARSLGINMRDSDAAEVWASSGFLPVEAVEMSIKLSAKSWAMTIDGEVAAVFGVADGSLLDGVAYPWALTSDLVDRHPREFYLASVAVLDYFRSLYPILVNAIDTRNKKSLRWARRVGFKVAAEPTPMGVRGGMFHPILMTQEEHHV